MNYKDSNKARAQRWAMIHEAIDLGVWDDELHFRKWLYAEFGTSKTSKLSEAMTRVLYIYLKYFTGKTSKEPDFGAAFPWRINNRQLWLIKQYKEYLDWSDEQLLNFITRQLGVNTFPRALSKAAATNIITGIEKLKSWKQKKQTQ